MVIYMCTFVCCDLPLDICSLLKVTRPAALPPTVVMLKQYRDENFKTEVQQKQMGR